MSSPAMHSEQLQLVQCRRDGCEVVFAPKTRWQTFYSVKCRNDHHHTRDPASVYREVEKLKRQVADLKDATEALTKRLDERDQAAAG